MKIRVAKKPADSYQHGDLREALVDAGLKLLSEGGVENLSLRAAAQLAGVSHAAPYRHYKDKEALVAAVAERGFKLLTESMQSELERRRAHEARQKIVALGHGYVGFATRHPTYLQLIFGGVLSKKDPPLSLQAAGTQAYLTLRNAVADGIQSGELRRVDPDEMALACWSLVHGYSTLVINGAVPRPESDQAERALTERLLALLGDGIMAVEH